MKRLSIIVAGRDDNYGEKISMYRNPNPLKFVQRLKKIIENNIFKLANKFKLEELQYVIVDWNPIDDRFLYKNFEIKDLLSQNFIKNVIVSSQSILNYGMSSNGFNECYAKNVGIRQSESEYSIITNTDDLFDDILINSIYEAVEKNNENEYYRPYSKKDVDENLNVLAEGLNFPINNIFEDNYLGTPAGGDFLMTKTNTLIERGKGFNENDLDHKINNHSDYTDGEIIWNLWRNKVLPVQLKGSILHLDHSKDAKFGRYNREQYENIPNWGFANYKITNINHNTVLI